ncbi:hypothetical protein AZE42_13136 [Rhizopogon vesiculosus]|uniref:Uncharacterized protein n=1 Tax=Rhizopogon vesiculosus TaxID=180088 RepID=A0A1J8Q0N7_9AGAM|nr:hypothetical protein AZE42_13136 [Rhizopogon vesiculosus]
MAPTTPTPSNAPSHNSIHPPSIASGAPRLTLPDLLKHDALHSMSLEPNIPTTYDAPPSMPLELSILLTYGDLI